MKKLLEIEDREAEIEDWRERCGRDYLRLFGIGSLEEVNKAYDLLQDSKQQDTPSKTKSIIWMIIVLLSILGIVLVLVST